MVAPRLPWPGSRGSSLPLPGRAAWPGQPLHPTLSSSLQSQARSQPTSAHCAEHVEQNSETGRRGAEQLRQLRQCDVCGTPSRRPRPTGLQLPLPRGPPRCSLRPPGSSLPTSPFMLQSLSGQLKDCQTSSQAVLSTQNAPPPAYSSSPGTPSVVLSSP